MEASSQDEPELHSESMVEGDVLPQSTSAFFPNAQHFVVTGGSFININPPTPTLPSDFRRIPMGDLDLRKEIRLDSGSGAVNRWHGRHSVRRMYSARIHGSKSRMTVAMYQGENAEEEWNRDISSCSWLRHPNFVQLYGTASSFGIYAMIFHDELIPAKEMLGKYQGSHSLTVYFWRQLDEEFEDILLYVYCVSGRAPTSWDCTLWIRPSTGHLCADLTRSRNDDLDLQLYGFCNNSPPLPVRSLLEPPADSEITDLIPLENYHEICLYHLSHYRTHPVFSAASVHLGALIYYPQGSDIEDSTEIAVIPDAKVHHEGWSVFPGGPLLTMESGWTRANSWEIGDRLIQHVTDSSHAMSWLSQANYIFDDIGVTSNHDDYLLVIRISYELRLFNTKNVPPGYLFLCPSTELQSDLSPSHFHRPGCPAYWSLDPSGAERLSTEKAEQLGFPCLKFQMWVLGSFWDESVYSGIRRFHQAKDFEPDTQDVARKLGYALFQASTNLEPRFAHIQEINTDSGYESFEAEVRKLNYALFQASTNLEPRVARIQEITLTADSEHQAEVPPSDEWPQESSHAESGPDSSLLQGAYFSFDAEVPKPSRNWNIIMGVQFALLLTLGILWLRDSFRV